VVLSVSGGFFLRTDITAPLRLLWIQFIFIRVVFGWPDLSPQPGCREHLEGAALSDNSVRSLPNPIEVHCFFHFEHHRWRT